MSRWWSSPEESLEILSLVDDSDVEQGVGTALLAYHGLAAGALEPLSKRTLVDVSMIRSSLDQVDLEPVAKALGRATKPIMGEVSDRYGELMASNMHRQAVEATERLLLSFTTKGMPWPVAIERVATVHGVPLEHLGKAAAELGAPAMNPTVRADIGDRALMGYAAHMGLAENTLESISKASQQMFDPSEHPRGQGGRFVAAPAKGEPVVDEEVLARRRRRRRRFDAFDASAKGNSRREAAAARAEQVVSHQQGFLSAMRHAFGEPALSEETTTAVDELSSRRTRREQIKAERRQARRQGVVEQEAEKPAEAKPQRPKVRALDEGKFVDPKPKDYEYRVQAERFALIPKRVTDRLADGNVLSFARIEKESQDQITWLTAEGMQERLDSLDVATAWDYVVVHIDGDFATASSSKYDDEMLMAPSAKLEASATFAESFDMYDYQQDFKVHGLMGNEFVDRDVPQAMLVMHVRMENAKEYGAQYEDDEPLPFDNPEIDKAYEFRESDVKRDAKGRFAFEGQRGPVSDIDQVLARRRRRKRRFSAMDRPIAQAVAADASRVSLKELAQATQVEEEQEQPQELLAPRDLLPSKTQQRRQARRQEVKDARRRGAGNRQRNADRNASAVAPDLSGKIGIEISERLYNVLTGTGDLRATDYAGGGTGAPGKELESIRQDLLTNKREAMEVVDAATPPGKQQVIPLNMSGSTGSLGYASDLKAYDVARNVLREAGSEDPRNPFSTGDEIDDMMRFSDLQLKLQEANGVAAADTIERKVNGRTVFIPAIRIAPRAQDKLLIVGDPDQIEALLSGQLVESKEPQTWSNRSLQEAAGADPTADKAAVTRLIDLDW